jgi:hypothetical protein
VRVPVVVATVLLAPLSACAVTTTDVTVRPTTEPPVVASSRAVTATAATTTTTTMAAATGPSVATVWTGGDPDHFCQVLGPYLTLQVLAAFATPADPVGAATTEVVFSPAVAPMARALAASAPDPLRASFRLAADRADAATAALRTAGADDARTGAVREALLARTASQAAAIDGGNPGDPRAYGLDPTRVRDAAAGFVASAGDLAAHRARLDALAPEPPAAEVRTRLGADWPCIGEVLAPRDAPGDDRSA